MIKRIIKIGYAFSLQLLLLWECHLRLLHIQGERIAEAVTTTLGMSAV